MNKCCRIPLSRGLFALVDEADAPEILRHCWWANFTSAQGRALRPYAVGRPFGHKGGLIYLHRWLLKPSPTQQVDHISGDSLDDRRSNLRLCTRAQNSANVRRSPGAAGFRGVTADGQRWRAQISVLGHRWRIGTFDAQEEAARAYDLEARKSFGAFARLNFPAAVK